MGQGQHILDAIGNTPLVELRRIVPPGSARIVAKLESANPTGSMKDRLARMIVHRAATSGRLPPGGWKPEGWTPPANANAMITANHVHLRNAHKTPAFWFLWIVLCMNVSAGIGIIGAASPMLQETFGGTLVGNPEMSFGEMKKDTALAAKAALVGAGFVGLISLFNIFGRIFWAS